MSNILRLIYVSRACEPVDESAVIALLDQARPRNEELGITGLLCSGRGHFVQALEGPNAHVIPLYAQIQRDARHQQATLVCVGLAAERAFPEWAMGHLDGELLPADTHARLVRQGLLEYKLPEHARMLRTLIRALRRPA